MTLNPSSVMKEVSVALLLCVFWDLSIADWHGTFLLIHPCLSLSQSEVGKVMYFFFFGSSCLAGKDGHFVFDSSSGRIYPVITYCGNSSI